MKRHFIITSILIGIFSAKSFGQLFNNLKDTSSKFEFSIELHTHIQETKTRIFFDNSIVKVLTKGSNEKINNDSTLFYSKLTSIDNLKFIHTINFDSLNFYYSNPCVDDGFTLEVFYSGNGVNKHIILDNYYQNNVGEVINFINTKLPERYKIWYDKKRLISDYKNCEKILLKEKH